LNEQNNRKQKGFVINFDPEYALNICEKKEYDLRCKEQTDDLALELEENRKA